MSFPPEQWQTILSPFVAKTAIEQDGNLAVVLQAKFAPVSWMLADHVKDGPRRNELLETWADLPRAEERAQSSRGESASR